MIYFSADLIAVRERCKANLTVSDGVSDRVILRPVGQSEFANDVLFDQSIITKGAIVNGDNNALNITSSSDLNLTSSTNDVNIRGGNQIVMNTQSVIVSNNLLANSIQPVAANDILSLSHTRVNIPNNLYTDNAYPIHENDAFDFHHNVVSLNILQGTTIQADPGLNSISILGNSISIGNPNGTSDIYLYGKVHYMNIVNNNAVDAMDEIDGFLAQSGI